MGNSGLCKTLDLQLAFRSLKERLPIKDLLSFMPVLCRGHQLMEDFPDLWVAVDICFILVNLR